MGGVGARVGPAPHGPVLGGEVGAGLGDGRALWDQGNPRPGWIRGWSPVGAPKWGPRLRVRADGVDGVGAARLGGVEAEEGGEQHLDGVCSRGSKPFSLARSWVSAGASHRVGSLNPTTGCPRSCSLGFGTGGTKLRNTGGRPLPKFRFASGTIPEPGRDVTDRSPDPRVHVCATTG